MTQRQAIEAARRLGVSTGRDDERAVWAERLERLRIRLAQLEESGAPFAVVHEVRRAAGIMAGRE